MGRIPWVGFPGCIASLPMVQVLPRSGRSPWWTVVAMSFASIALTIDLFGINVALPDIGRDLGLSDTELQWVVTAYYLGLAAPLAAAGRIGDLFGRRRLLVLGTLVFAAGSVLAAVAESGGLLVVSRLVAGVGAALQNLSSITVPPVKSTPRCRPRMPSAPTAIRNVASEMMLNTSACRMNGMSRLILKNSMVLLPSQVNG